MFKKMFEKMFEKAMDNYLAIACMQGQARLQRERVTNKHLEI